MADVYSAAIGSMHGTLSSPLMPSLVMPTSKYDTTNAFAIDVQSLTFERFRADSAGTGELPQHIETAKAVCTELAQLGRDGGKFFIDPDPAPLELPDDVPIRQQIGHKLSTPEEEYHANQKRAKHIQTLKERKEIIRPILARVHVWRKARTVLKKPALFGPGNHILDSGPLGAPLPEYAIKYLPKFVRSLFDDTYFAAAVAMVCTNRNAFRNLFVSVEHRDMGMYVFQFFERWDNHTPGWRVVAVDDSIPTDITAKPLMGRMVDENETWFSLLEAAYAKFRGSYSFLHHGEVPMAIVHLTGCEVTLDEWDASTWGDESTQTTSYDTLAASPRETNLSLLWWRLTEGTNLGFMQAVCRQPNVRGVQGIRSTQQGEHDPAPNAEREWDSASTHIVLQAITLNTPGPDAYLIKLRKIYGDTFWTGAWSNRSKDWTVELRALADNRHVDNFITWMSIEDFVVQFNTMCTCTSVPNGPTVVFRDLLPVKVDGMLPFHAHQYLIVVTDPADPTHTRVRQTREKTKTKLVEIPEEIRSDEEDSDEDLDEDDEPIIDANEARSSASVSIAGTQNLGGGLSIRRGSHAGSFSPSVALSGKSAEEPSRYQVLIYLSQPDLGSVDVDGHYMAGASVKPVVATLFRVSGRELQQPLVTDTDFTDNPDEVDEYSFPTVNKMELVMEPQDDGGFRQLGVVNLHPGHYVVALHQDFHKNEIKYLLACQGEDDGGEPTGYNVAIEDLGTWASPKIEVKREEAAKPQKAEPVNNQREERAKRLLGLI